MMLPAALLLALTGSGAARAGDPREAQALFDRGVAKMLAGRYEEGCPALEQSYKLDPLPGALFALADCELKWGKFAAAAARYDEYLALYPKLAPAAREKHRDRAERAREHRAALAAKVAELSLVLAPSAPKGTVVFRDDVEIGAGALGVPAPVDPGEHVIRSRAPDGTITEARVKLAAGEKRAVVAAVRLAAPEAAGPSGSDSMDRRPAAAGASRPVVIAGAAVSGAGVVLGAVLLGLGAAKASTVKTLQDEVKVTGGCASTTTGGPCAELRDALYGKAGLGNAGLGLLIGGGVVGVGTLVVALAAGRSADAARSGVRVSPVVTARGGGFSVGGAW